MSAVATEISETAVKPTESPPVPAKRPRVGTGVPGPGRPKGSQDRITRTIKDAIEMAARDCHPRGLAGWLVERAQGGVQDRQIFATMVAKVLPAQLQAQVDGAIVVQLPWLQGRNVGGFVPSASHHNVIDAQVVDITMEKDGSLRVSDPKPVPSASHHNVIDAQVVDITMEKDGSLRVSDPKPALEAPKSAQSDPHPPINRQAGGGEE